MHGKVNAWARKNLLLFLGGFGDNRTHEKGGGMMAECPLRHGMAHARFFLQKVVACQTEQREECEAYLHAALLFARTALLRLGPTYGKHPHWKQWWKNVLIDTTAQPAVEFLRHERHWMFHHAPA